MVTGVRPSTFEKLQLNAGMFLVGFDWSSAENADAIRTKLAAAIEAETGLIGMTQGGGTFVCTPAIRQIEGDGMRSPFVGSTVNDGWTVKLTGTMKEITPENFARALMCANVEAIGSCGTAKKIRIRTDIKTTDYLPKICWVGDTSKGFVLIELENALNISGATFTFTDKGEGTIPFEFQAHQSNVLNQEYAPCTIVFFDSAA